MESYRKANELFVEEEYEEALEEYTKAIESDDKNAEFYNKRAACYLKLNKHINALQDANAAITLEPSNANGYLRKGIAYFEQQEFASAKKAFEQALAISDKSQTRRWIRKCEAELQQDQSAEDLPKKSSESNSVPAEAPKSNNSSTSENKPLGAAEAIPSLASDEAKNDLIPPAAPKIRHEWYQSQSHVVITIYAANVTKEQADIQFEPQELSVSLKLSENNEFVLDLNLCAKIDVTASTVHFYATKVEIKLAKVEPVRWLALEADSTKQFTTVSWDDASKVDKHTYPSSNKVKKNWDLIAKGVEDEKLEGEQALNKVFQDIYGRGSDDQRRAMMKSFVESGGTVLSTNWDDIGSRYVEGSAPKGAEMKKWTDLHK